MRFHIRAKVAVLLALLLLLASVLALAGSGSAVVAAKTTRVSVSSAGGQGSAGSYVWRGISATGRFVAFESNASNLVGFDENGATDIFVRDRRTRITRRVSVSSAGAEANGGSELSSMSASGRFVAFWSNASNLVRRDANGAADIFVRDRRTGTTRRVSVSSAGAEGNGASDDPVISADGRFVAFGSEASNLVGRDRNGYHDIFVRDRRTGTTRRVSVSSAGIEANGGSALAAISANGRFVVFESSASNLVAGDINGLDDIFVRDRGTATTRRVSVSSAGAESNGASDDPAISADGRFVAFSSAASNLVGGDTNGQDDIFVRDRRTGTTRRVSVSSAGGEGDDGSNLPAISADGRFVIFVSGASNHVAGDTNNANDVFIRDRRTGTTRRVSVSSTGVQGNDFSSDAAISADGRFVAFWSNASNLDRGDTNGAADVFLRGPLRRR